MVEKIKVRSKLGSGSTFIVSIPFGCDHLEPEQIGEKRESYQPGRVGSAYLAEASRWVPLETGPPDNIPLTKSDSAETSFCFCTKFGSCFFTCAYFTC